LRFGDEDIAFRIDGHIMRHLKLPRQVAGTAKFANDLQRSAVEDEYLLIG